MPPLRKLIIEEFPNHVDGHVELVIVHHAVTLPHSRWGGNGYLASRRPHIDCGSLPRRQAGATYNKAQLAAKDAPSGVAMGIRADRGR